ncbi:MAG: terminase TerL endonuclease subunit [Pseudonocardiales bacterium]
MQLWEPPATDPSYRVPVADVEEAVRQACRRWDVREIAADPFRWTRTLQALDAERLPVVEFPQSPQRMTPATTALFEAVVNRQVTHSGDPRLARHVADAVVKEDARGTRLAKGTITRRIDLAVAVVMAYDRARQNGTGDYDILQSVW